MNGEGRKGEWKRWEGERGVNGEDRDRGNIRTVLLQNDAKPSKYSLALEVLSDMIIARFVL